ncbi:MAG: hypothetical protein KBG15_00665 [Kofleriaceae bacterium]|nr:hypothetical protein [Kofleriaceae bacterium]
MKLGALLLQNAAIGQSQLDAALRNQVLFGGRLGTNLVELGYIELEQLAEYLEELTGFPPATVEMLEQAPDALLSKLGADFAITRGAIPLGHLAGDAAVAIAVAFIDPFDSALIDDVAQRLGAQIVPYIVPELRGVYFLERHFGLLRRARFIRSGGSASALDAPAAADNRRRVQPAGGIVMPPAFTLEPRRRRQPSSSPASTNQLLATPFAEICQRIEDAEHRDQLAQALIQFGRGRTSAFVAFMIRDSNALGWCGYVARGQSTIIPTLSLPLAGVSAFQDANDTQRVFHGLPPCLPHPVESALWAALDGETDPVDMVVAPVLVKQRVATLLYAQGSRLAPMAAMLVEEVTVLAGHVTDAYARLIRDVKLS